MGHRLQADLVIEFINLIGGRTSIGDHAPKAHIIVF